MTGSPAALPAVSPPDGAAGASACGSAASVLDVGASPAGESPSCPEVGVDVVGAAEADGASDAAEPPVACGGAGRNRPSRTSRLSSWV